MGNFLKNKQDASWSTNKAIREKMKDRRRNRSRTHQLVLLGTSSSGKSTLFKSIKSIYWGWNPASCVPAIRRNCISVMLCLLRRWQQWSDGDRVDEEMESAIRLTVKYESESFCECDQLDYEEMDALGLCLLIAMNE